MSDDNPRNMKRYSLHPMSLQDALKKAMNAGKPIASGEQADHSSKSNPNQPSPSDQGESGNDKG